MAEQNKGLPAMETAGRDREHQNFDAFKIRVKEWTGMDFDRIPKGERGDALYPMICRFGDICVVGYGYPEKDSETGEETFTEFRVVDLSE